MKLLSLLLVLLSYAATAQISDWAWTTQGRGNACSQAITRTSAGEYTVAGHFREALTLGGQVLVSAGGEDVLLVHYNAQGQVLWARQAGGSGRDGGTALATDAAGNLYVAGYFQHVATFGPTTLTSAGGDDAFLAKYDPAGVLQWVKAAGGLQADYASSVTVYGPNWIVVGGQFQGAISFGSATLNHTGAAAGFLTAYDTQGIVQGAVSLPDSFVGGVAATRSGQLCVAGALAPSGSLLVQFDATGTRRWSSAAAGTAMGTCIALDADGSVYVAGRFRDTLRVGRETVVSRGSYDGFLAKFDSLGAGQWVRGLGGSDEDLVRGLALAGPGAVAVTGYVRGNAFIGSQVVSTSPACNSVFVASYAGNGVLQWVKAAAGTVSAGGTGLVFDATGDESSITGTFQGELTFGNVPPVRSACADDLFLAHLTTVLPDLVVTTAQSVQGRYRNVTVAATGVATLAGPLRITGELKVQAGGQLDTQCQPITGPGSFTLEAGAELRICHATGIAATGAAGAIQVTGPRRFSTEARYVYTGNVAQQTGSGLPAQVRLLALDNAAGLTLTQPLRVVQGLRLTHGNLVLAGQNLTLISDAAGTAQVDNAGGVVQGTVTVQRYLDPSRNAGMGYRHLSSPVQAAPVADLMTATFTPVTNPLYNTASAPSNILPYPTVFGYDETRLSTATNNLADFDKGYFSPANNATRLEVLRGYAVQLAGNQLVDFVGELNNGPLTVALTRGPQADAGWNLIGNPYPSTLDWSRVTLPTGLDNAMYVFQSSGPYTGQYRSYINGVGNPLIALGQGFLVRPNTRNSAISLTLTNAARVADFGTAPVLNRQVATSRPLLQLSLLQATTGRGDETTVYFETGATQQAEARFDAAKVPTGPTALASLGTMTPAGDKLAINGLPLPTVGSSVALWVQVPQPGSYTLVVAQYAHLVGVTCFLQDAQTGRSIRLGPQVAYPFQTLKAGDANNRFSLRFEPVKPLLAP